MRPIARAFVEWGYFERKEVRNEVRLYQAQSPGEQRRLMQLLVDHVAYDAANARVAITFRPTRIATLAATDATDAHVAATGQQGGQSNPTPRRPPRDAHR